MKLDERSISPHQSLLFVAVSCQPRKSFTAVILLAKHAQLKASDRNRPGYVGGIQRLPAISGAMNRKRFGEGKFIVRPDAKAALGVLPNFLRDDRKDERRAQIASNLLITLASARCVREMLRRLSQSMCVMSLECH